jgi:transcriptional regulator with XRE-family HTH domain
MSMGARIKEAMDAAGLQQQDVCAKVPGLSQQSLSNLVKRDSKTSEFAIQIADALGVSVRWLLDGAGRRTDQDWPFGRVSRARWDACGDEDRGYVQAAMNRALDECEQSRTGNAKAA